MPPGWSNFPSGLGTGATSEWQVHERLYWWLAIASGAAAFALDGYQHNSLFSDGMFVLSGLIFYLAARYRKIAIARAITMHLGIALALVTHEMQRPFSPNLAPDQVVLAREVQGAFAYLGVLALALFGGPFGLALGMALALFAKHPTSSAIVAYCLSGALGIVGLSLHRAFAQLSSSRSRLQGLAYIDGLTGLPNRRAVEAQFETYQALAKRGQTAFSMMIWDLDNLKSINDQEGHLAGDNYIVGFARCLKESLRKGDMAFRVGGDEFISFHMRLDNGDPVAARVRARTPSVSVGWAQDKDDTFESLLSKADERMYEDKAARRISAH
jgi:diguanylate cyclase (GGDEF)-like protein